MIRYVLSVAAIIMVLVAQTAVCADSPVQSVDWSQLPDMVGGIAFSSEYKAPSIVADDWVSNGQDTAVMGIRWWGAYWKPFQTGSYVADADSLLNMSPGGIDSFRFSIYTNVPTAPDVPFAYPGAKVWEFTTSTFSESAYGTTTKGRDVFEYAVLIPEAEWFQPTEGQTYWLSIEANLPDTTKQWGWIECANEYHIGAASVQNFDNRGWKTITNNYYDSNMAWTFTPVPEPGSIVALAAGIFGIAGCAARRRKK